MSGVNVPQPVLPYSPFVAQNAASSTNFPWLQVDVTHSTYGADPTGILDSTAAFQAAMDVAGPHCVLIPDGTYLITAEVLVRIPRTHVIGKGQHVSVVKFVPASGGLSPFHFKLPTAGVIEQCSIRHLTIVSTETTFQKFMVKGTDVSIFTVEDISSGSIGQWTGGTAIAPFTGGSSAGILLKGREQITIRECVIAADIPLWIDDNPNASIDIDHAHIYDNYFAAGGTNPNLYISSGVNLTNVTIDGRNSWVLGRGAIHWIDTTSAQISHNLVVDNIRYEQPTTRAYVIDIEHNTALLDFQLNNFLCGAGTTMDGLKIRQVRHPKIDVFAYNGTGVAINADTTAVSMDLKRLFTQDNSTISMGNMILLDAEVRTNTLSPNSRYELWIDPANALIAAGESKWFQGRWYYNGPVPSARTLASGAAAAFPTMGGAGTQGSITVRAHGATVHEEITATFDVTGAYKAYGSANTDAGPGAVGGKLVVLFGSLASMAIKNDLGESVTYSYEIVQW